MIKYRYKRQYATARAARADIARVTGLRASSVIGTKHTSAAWVFVIPDKRPRRRKRSRRR